MATKKKVTKPEAPAEISADTPEISADDQNTEVIDSVDVLSDSPEISAGGPEISAAPPEISAPSFPAVPASGQWTAAEHDQAVAAYEYALSVGDPDAGRMRTVIGLFQNPERPLCSDRVQI